jgi:hypothetical protein
MDPGLHRPHDLCTTSDTITRHKNRVDAFIQGLFSKGDIAAVDRYLDPRRS